jgi:hypothetical protein
MEIVIGSIDTLQLTASGGVNNGYEGTLPHFLLDYVC